MAKNDMPTVTATCVVCRQEKSVRYSLRLEKAEGCWTTNPVCDACRSDLVKQAVAEGLFMPFFPILSSRDEAERRNKQMLVQRPFLAKFGRKQREDASKQGAVIPMPKAGRGDQSR